MFWCFCPSMQCKEHCSLKLLATLFTQTVIMLVDSSSSSSFIIQPSLLWVQMWYLYLNLSWCEWLMVNLFLALLIYLNARWLCKAIHSTPISKYYPCSAMTLSWAWIGCPLTVLCKCTSKISGSPSFRIKTNWLYKVSFRIVATWNQFLLLNWTI